MKFKKIFILVLIVILNIAISNIFAGEQNKDKILWDITMMQLKDKDWNSAEKTLKLLKKKHPDNQVINNLLSIIFFNQGRTEIAQELLIDIIESNQQTKIAYYNLKKIYSYSAAKTYSEGLQLLTPVKRPMLSIDQSIIEYTDKQIDEFDLLD